MRHKLLQVAHNLLRSKSPVDGVIFTFIIGLKNTQSFIDVIFSFDAKASYLASLPGYLPHPGKNPKIEEIEFFSQDVLGLAGKVHIVKTFPDKRN